MISSDDVDVDEDDDVDDEFDDEFDDEEDDVVDVDEELVESSDEPLSPLLQPVKAAATSKIAAAVLNFPFILTPQYIFYYIKRRLSTEF